MFSKRLLSKISLLIIISSILSCSNKEDENKIKELNIKNESLVNELKQIKLDNDILVKKNDNLTNEIDELKKSPSQRYSEAINFINKKDNEEAEKIFREIIAKYPNDKFSNDSKNKLSQMYNKELNSLKYKIKTVSTKDELINIESEIRDLRSNYSQFDNGEANKLLVTCKNAISNFDKYKRDNYLKSCGKYEYKRLERDADDLKGKKIKFSGKVFHIEKQDGVMAIQINVTHKGYGFWDDQVYVYYKGSANVYKDDYVSVAGEINGKLSYQSVSNWNITVPSVLAEYIWKN
jgi:hypothetical protein